MRPLLSVVLVPSMPMKEDRLSTAGSFRITCGERLLALGHGRERDRLRRFRNAQNHAGVLHREEAFGDHHVEVAGQAERADRHHQGGGTGAAAPPSASCRRTR